MFNMNVVLLLDRILQTSLFPSVSIPLSHYRYTHAVEKTHEECFMWGSGVLHCALTLLLRCEGPLEAIDSFRLAACEQDNRGEQCRPSSSPPLSTPIVRDSAYTVAFCAVFTSDLVCYGIISGLSKNSHNSCVLCCRLRSPELPEMTCAVDKQPDDIWTDLEQHITFHFPDTPWPMSHQGPSSSFVPPPLWSWQVSLCWQWPLKCCSARLTDAWAVSQPTQNVFLSVLDSRWKRNTLQRGRRETSMCQHWHTNHPNQILVHYAEKRHRMGDIWMWMERPSLQPSIPSLSPFSLAYGRLLGAPTRQMKLRYLLVPAWPRPHHLQRCRHCGSHIS